ncbi:MAG: hypothetical protein IKO97_05895 [Erysipelotrichaceae bacterium]|nr:hypothetical protein [Erysipelotrichaceae bacterium]MBR6260617.1 hypothetical protein [Erysipelotrichaceae bacterium]
MIILSAEDIDVIMKSVGAISVDNNNEKIYKREDGYYRLSLVQGLGGYVIEYAETEEEVKKNLFEDIGVIGNDRTEEAKRKNNLFY